jgi:hypothetical protein
MELLIIIAVLIVLSIYFSKRDPQFAEALGSFGKGVAVVAYLAWALFVWAAIIALGLFALGVLIYLTVLIGGGHP